MELPKSWSGVTIATFQKCYTITKLNKGTDDMSILNRDIQIIATLADVKVSEVEKMKAIEFDEAKRQVAFIYGVPEETKIPLEFDLRGTHYKSQIFFEGLEVEQIADIKSLRLKGGQIIDHTSLAWSEETKDDSIYNMHKFLACVCIPENEKGEYVYGGNAEVAEIFLQHLTMDIAYPLQLFFSNVGSSFSTSIQTYFLKQHRKNLKNLKREMGKFKKEEMVS